MQWYDFILLNCCWMDDLVFWFGGSDLKDWVGLHVYYKRRKLHWQFQHPNILFAINILWYSLA